MFKIIAAPNEPDDFGIYFNNKFVAEAYYDKDHDTIQNDDYTDFDISLLRKIIVSEYPDNFMFRFITPKPHLKFFDMFDVKRKGKGIAIGIFASFDDDEEDNKSLKNLLWNPKYFVKEAKAIASKKGFDTDDVLLNDDSDPYTLILVFYFPIKEKQTLGNLFDILFKETAAVIHEAEMVLFNEAAKRLEKKK